jgi:hypothetical protein
MASTTSRVACAKTRVEHRDVQAQLPVTMGQGHISRPPLRRVEETIRPALLYVVRPTRRLACPRSS